MLTDELGENVTRFEPRIEQPTLELLGCDDQLRIHFLVRGAIDGRLQSLVILVDAIYGRVAVKNAEEL
jgi:hypothetical protein